MSQKILIVEDEQDVVRLLRHNLEKEGYRTRYVTDGRVALAEMRRLAETREETPDLVILDLMLPGVDGLEICRQMRRHERYRTTPAPRSLSVAAPEFRAPFRTVGSPVRAASA